MTRTHGGRSGETLRPATTYTDGDTVPQPDDATVDDEAYSRSQVAEMIEIAYSLAAHQARVCPLALLQHESQDWQARISARTRALRTARELVGARRP